MRRVFCRLEIASGRARGKKEMPRSISIYLFARLFIKGPIR